ncbi:MAG: tRNA lysidine(34) synthetase TilS [Candidatus Omnitrophica bacterium]|nr:tRNA lysidine(34) synthetase TilS [Candidatus Omnitrophota bacterium]
MILDTVRQAIKRYRMLDKGDKVLIGVSGGPDSVSLLYILSALRKEFKLNLHIAHLDHMLRADSAKDREFVEGLAGMLKIPVISESIDVMRLAEKGSLEEIAREARLAFFFRTAKKIKADKIALGHTRDDQAETILMRIIRGSGLYGLSGILPKRRIAGFQVIRPLIEVPRRQIAAFLKKKKAGARQDPSNLEDIYFRNRVRNKLLPLLRKQYNPNIGELLANMAQGVAADYEYLNAAAGKALLRLKKGGGKGKVDLDLKGFLKLHPAIQRLVLRLAISGLAGSTRRLTFQHIKEIEDLIFNRPVNSVVDLPKGVCIVKKKQVLAVFIKQK